MIFPTINVFKSRMWAYIILNFRDIAFMRFYKVFGVNLALVI